MGIQILLKLKFKMDITFFFLLLFIVLLFWTTKIPNYINIAIYIHTNVKVFNILLKIPLGRRDKLTKVNLPQMVCVYLF